MNPIYTVAGHLQIDYYTNATHRYRKQLRGSSFVYMCAVGYLKVFFSCVQCVTEFVKLYLNHLLIAIHFFYSLHYFSLYVYM